MEVVGVGIGERIRTLRQQHDMTQEQLAAALGVGGPSVSEWERGKKTPLMGRVYDMAEVFGVQVSDLIAAETRAAYTSDASAPLYGRIAAGAPVESLVVEDRLWCPPDVLRAHPRGFFLRVTGESMNRVLPNGCFAFVDPDDEVSSGDIAAVHVNGCDATVKRYHRMSTSVVLQAESTDPAERDLVFDYSKPGTDVVAVIGRVVWRTFPVGVRL
jgi:repressor LexA